MLRRIWIAAALLLITATCAPAQTFGIPANRARLRAAGIEPSLEGVRSYLESLLEPETDKQIDRWIAELADPEFEVREQASLRLASLELATVAAKLQAAASGSDPERAWRAKQALQGANTGSGLLLAALGVVEEEKLPVGLPLLLRIRGRLASPAVQESAVRAMLAIVAESDRAALARLKQHDEAAVRGAAARLLARLDRPPARYVEGAFDAVKLTPGQVSGGGRNLVEGWEFRPTAEIVVTHLGIFDAGRDGLAAQHEIAIWDVEDPSGPVTQETIYPGQAAALVGAFRLVPTTAVKLAAGRRYAIVAHYPDASDPTVGMINPAGLMIEYGEHIEALGRRDTFPHESMAFPERFSEGAKHSKHGPTFRYALAAEANNKDEPKRSP